MVRSTNKQITNLHSVHASVKSLKEVLMRSQEQIRADLSLRFAASIFSTSGNPGPDLAVSLVICAIVALVITVFALVNAKALGRIIRRGFHPIDIYSRAKMKHSILTQRREGRQKEVLDEEAKDAQISRPAGKDWFGNDLGERLWALPTYIPRAEYLAVWVLGGMHPP
ncbi:hypothetical protein DL771_007114 [Monosporascus sp. 5C6A]|nr:hypothetical protein DL771_007114 [Monosporascus sp. 5C6A]